MAITSPQYDLMDFISGGVDSWDDGPAGVILQSDFFVPPVPIGPPSYQEIVGRNAINSSYTGISSWLYSDGHAYGEDPGEIKIFYKTNLFGTGSIVRGTVGIVGTGIGDSDAFGVGSILKGSVTISGPGLLNPHSFGGGSVKAETVILAGIPLVNTAVYGNGIVSQTIPSHTISGTGFGGTSVFGTGTILIGEVAVTGTALYNVQAFGSGSLPQLLTISGLGFLSSQIFGNGAVSTSQMVVSGTGHIGSPEFGSGLLETTIALFGSGSAESNAFGSGKLSSETTVSGVGYQNVSHPGNGKIELVNQVIRGTGFSNSALDRKYFMDSSGNIYWIVSRELGIVEKV